jgi:hypothetical protein
LFPASIGKTGKLSRRALVRTDAAVVVVDAKQSACQLTRQLATNVRVFGPKPAKARRQRQSGLGRR